jgi:hypothetical protein
LAQCVIEPLDVTGLTTFLANCPMSLGGKDCGVCLPKIGVTDRTLAIHCHHRQITDGKSTTLHRLIRTARTVPWANLLIANGKSVEFTRYVGADLRVYGEDEVEAFAALAEAIDLFERMGMRRELKEARAELARLDEPIEVTG